MCGKGVSFPLGISKANGNRLCPPGRIQVVEQAGALGFTNVNGLSLPPSGPLASLRLQQPVGIHAFN